MKNLICFIGFIFMLSATAMAQSGHLPFDHAHSSDCGATGGVCYGYAMGKSAGAGAGIYSACDPATMIPPGTCLNYGLWAGWTVEGSRWQETSDQYLDNVPSGSIISFGNHVSICGSSINSSTTFVTLYHIRSSGGTPTSDVMYRQSDRRWKLVMSTGTYWAQSYYTLKSFNVTAQNKFYDGTTGVTNQGSVTIAGSNGTSPVTVSRVWTGDYTASATSPQNFPTGYQQIFNNSWLRGGSPWGTSTTVSIEVGPLGYTYEAQFYRAAAVTLTPAGGGGGINSGSGTKYVSDTIYPRVYPTPADQVNATAVNTNSNRTDYLFANWTNSGNSNVDYTSSISFYPTAAITYTANFTAKPWQAENCYAGGVVGNPVQIT